MSAMSFRQVYMAGAVAAAALGCYLVSLRVASERNAVELAERQILETKKEIRSLQTEIGTRGRLAQLERWNASVIRLSAPQADQFVGDGFQLATLTQPHKVSPMEAPVILASAPAPEAPTLEDKVERDGADTGKAAPPAAPAAMLHVASYERKTTTSATAAAPARPATAKPAPAKPAATKPAASSTATKVAKPAAKRASVAAADPLAPAGKGSGRN